MFDYVSTFAKFTSRVLLFDPVTPSHFPAFVITSFSSVYTPTYNGSICCLLPLSPVHALQTHLRSEERVSLGQPGKPHGRVK